MARYSLTTIFVVAAVLVILVVSSIVGYITYVNSTLAVNAVTQKLHREIATRVVEHLQAFLDLPHIILEQNARLIGSGLVDPHDQAGLQTLFAQQVAIHPSLTSLYFGNTEGGLAGAGHEGRRQAFYTTGTEGYVAGPFVKRLLDPQAQDDPPLLTLPGYDARTRPWYRAAVRAGTAGVWGMLYPLFTGNDLALPPSRAVRDDDGRLLGVMGADIFTSHIARFLTELHTRTPGLTYIMDRFGLLVTSSTGELPFAVDSDGRPGARLMAGASDHPVIAASARELLAPDGTAKAPDGGTVTRDLRVDGTGYILEATPFLDPRGIDWLIVTAVPAETYTGPIRAANLRTMMFIGLAALLMALAVAVLVRRLLAPLQQVAESAKAVGHGDLSPTLDEHRGAELGTVARAFNFMIDRLRAAQEQQARQMAELRAAETRFRGLFHNANVPLCTEDLTGLVRELDRLAAEGVTDVAAHLRRNPDEARRMAGLVRVTDMNAAMANLLGVSAAAGASPVTDDLDITVFFAPGTLEAFIDKVAAIHAGHSEYHAESRLCTASGEERIIMMSMPIPTNIESFRSVPVSLVDLTDRKDAELALHRKNAELERSNAELESFAHVAAHDLREPLRTMGSYATLLRRRARDRLDDDEKQFLDFIHGGALRMDALISDLLDLARVGRSGRAMGPVDLGAVVALTLDSLRTPITEAGANVSVARDLPMVQGHEEDLTRVFTNLIANAIKYRAPDRRLVVSITAEPVARVDMIKHGTAPPASDVEAAPVPGWRVSIRDNGIGLARDQGHERRIFGLFQRLHHRDAHGGGTGIGLAICKKVIETHGGRIFADSPGENQGCTISFTLPAATDAPQVLSSAPGMQPQA